MCLDQPVSGSILGVKLLRPSEGQPAHKDLLFLGACSALGLDSLKTKSQLPVLGIGKSLK